MGIDIAIISPIEVEYHAVRRYLGEMKEQTIEGSVYETGQFRGRNQTYEVVIRQTGSKNTDIALATDKIIRCFHPAVVLLVGIAGGVKDVSLGDIVVGTKAYGYESGKVVDGALLARPESIPYDTDLLEQARSLARQPSWQQTTLLWKKIPKIVFGPIASGDKVIASTQSPEYIFIKNNFNDTTALEMESIGFAKAAFPHKMVRIMNIRGISDLLDNKSHTDGEGGQETAAAYAAAFSFALLDHIDLKLLKVKEINNELSNKVNNTNTGEIRKLIGNNRTKSAIEQLLQLTNEKDEDLHNQTTQLSNRWKKLQREETMGILSTSEANIINNQIIHGLLSVISELES